MNQKITDLFLQKINLVKEKYNNLVAKRTSLIENGDSKNLKIVSKELSFLEPLFFLCTNFSKNLSDIKQLATSLENESDKEMCAAINTEINNLQTENAHIITKFTAILSTKNENFSSSAIFEIKGTSGGDEANLFAAELYRMYCSYAVKRKWVVENITLSESPGGGFASAIFKIKGKNAFGTLQFEAGIHRVQRVPKTESRGRLHTSAAAVIVLPEEKTASVQINLTDLRIDTYRSSGAGGQHVNKTDSAVRITHLPTKIVVTSQDGRSQHDNKDRAMIALRGKLLAKFFSEQQSKEGQLKKSAFGSGDRSEKIRTYNMMQDRITDHRVNISWSQMNKILLGNIQDIIDALQEHEKYQALQDFS